MSLTIFHYVFVTVSTLLSGGVAVWAIRECLRTGEVATGVFAAISILFGIGLLFYLRWVRRKFHSLGVR